MRVAAGRPDRPGGRGALAVHAGSAEPKDLAPGLAADIAWLDGVPRVEPLALDVPTDLTTPQRDFIRLAITARRLLWSCHYAVDRQTAVLWTLARRGALPALVVCPASGVPRWLAGGDDSLFGRSLGVAPYGTSCHLRGVDVAVITYSKLYRLSASDLQDLGRETRALVLDESHRAREETSRTRAAVRALIESLTSETPIWALSTRPVANRLRELCAQLELFGLEDGPLTDPQRLAAVLAARPELVARSLAEMGLLVHHGAEAVSQLLPPVTRRLVPVPLETAARFRVGRQQRAFEDFLTTGRLLDAGGATPPPPSSPDAGDQGIILRDDAQLSTMLLAAPTLQGLDRFRAALLLEEMRTAIGFGKLEAALRLIRERMSEAPTLVLVEHRGLGERLAVSLGIPYLSGSVRPAQRRRMCQSFQNGECAGLVLSMRLEAVPPLTRAASAVVVELPWNQALIDLALRCVVLPGADHAIAVDVLTAEGLGLEGFIRRLHAYKEVVSEAVLRGIDQEDRRLVAALQEGLAIERAGLHPDDWFQAGATRALPAALFAAVGPTTGPQRLGLLASPHEGTLRRASAGTIRTPHRARMRRWRLSAPGWGEKERPCHSCGRMIAVGWLIHVEVRAVICDSCHAAVE